MSNVGLGAFVQGLSQGYLAGDKLQTAEEDRAASRQVRELRGLQINKARRDLENEADLDIVRKDLANAAANMIKDQSDENVARWRQASINYTAKAEPGKLADVQKAFKQEDLEKTGREFGKVVNGLMWGTEGSIEAASKLYGFIPDGYHIDPSKSGRNEDGSIRFNIVNTNTGQAQDKVFKPEDIFRMGVGYISNADKALSLNTELSLADKKDATTRRGQDMDYRASSARTNVIDKGNQVNENYRRDALADRELSNDLGEIQKIFAPRVQAIKDNIDAKLDEKTQARMLGDIEARAGFVDSVVRKNREMGIRVPVRQVAANVDSLMKGEGIVGVPKGMENSGYGLTAQGYLVPLPPNAKVTPKK